MTAGRIPFTPEDEVKLRSLGTWMMVLAIIHIVIGLLYLGGGCCGTIGAGMGVASMASMGGGGGEMGIVVILGLVVTAIFAFVGVFWLAQAFMLFKAKQGLDAAVASGPNQADIAGVFKQVKTFLILESAYMALMILSSCLSSASSVAMMGMLS